ncbi:MAG: MFS transporter [Acidobacteria bacterium]|jgi:2-oxoisovalerate dehydrogenase E1 component|nr:MFS transporter [Acidobacteriota bacterium]
MPRLEPLQPMVPWFDVSTTPEDWDNAPPDILGTILTRLYLIRAFEEKVLDLAGEGLIHGPVHSSIGQEGVAVGSCVALRPSDQVNGSHRAHHQFLAKSLGFLADTDDPTAEFSARTEELVQRTMAEIAGLADGFCKGRGGSMHLRWKNAGVLGTNAIVGGGVPFAAGAAFAQRRSGSDDVVVTYFGDGAVNIGSVLETMNLSAAWKLPLLFFIENNLYAVATHFEDVSEESRASSRGQAFGIPSWRVDGMDPLAVKIATDLALEVLRAENGPAIIEANCYRYFHQSGPLPGSAFGYRSKEEEQEWRARDPLELVKSAMIDRDLVTVEDINQLAERARSLMQRCAERLTETVDNRRRIRDELWPKPEFRDVGIRGDLSELDGLRNEEELSFSGPLHERKFVDAVADVMHRRMASDDSIIVLGEDIHRLKGGTNGATRGLAEAFPDRILCTPISENAFVGLGGGVAADGRFKPVVELMYADFSWVAADQIFNQIAKARHMFGGDIDMPLVLRTKVAMGTGYGSQHSMDPTGTYAASPGWRIVAASTPFDYVGLMNSALACQDPVLVLEHVALYQTKGRIPVDDLDYYIPLGKAKIARSGSVLTILTYLSMVHEAVEAVNNLGIDAEVVDLRSLDRASLDWHTIEASVQKTNNVIVVEQGSLGHSYGGMLADEIQRRLLDWLDQPVLRVHGGEASPSISKVLERAAIAGQSEIEVCLRTAMSNLGTPLPD